MPPAIPATSIPAATNPAATIPAATIPATTRVPSRATASRLRVLTLNLGHGRARDWGRLLQSGERARRNLRLVAGVLTREQPDVVALQEVDNNSVWNGRFDHGAWLARTAKFPHHFAGRHHVSALLDYGTALLSRVALTDAANVAFDSAVARPRKGFVVSTATWPGSTLKVDLVSLHLDFLSPAKRRAEVRQLQGTLAVRARPCIVMGDFNTGYDGALLEHLAKALDLHAFEPHVGHITFPSLRRRLDWVLISNSLRFASHQVLSDPVSDHNAVLADLELC